MVTNVDPPPPVPVQSQKLREGTERSVPFRRSTLIPLGRKIAKMTASILAVPFAPFARPNGYVPIVLYLLRFPKDYGHFRTWRLIRAFQIYCLGEVAGQDRRCVNLLSPCHAHHSSSVAVAP